MHREKLGFSYSICGRQWPRDTKCFRLFCALFFYVVLLYIFAEISTTVPPPTWSILCKSTVNLHPLFNRILLSHVVIFFYETQNASGWFSCCSAATQKGWRKASPTVLYWAPFSLCSDRKIVIDSTHVILFSIFCNTLRNKKLQQTQWIVNVSSHASENFVIVCKIYACPSRTWFGLIAL